jgi:hypothetical protein
MIDSANLGCPTCQFIRETIIQALAGFNNLTTENFQEGDMKVRVYRGYDSVTITLSKPSLKFECRQVAPSGECSTRASSLYLFPSSIPAISSHA